MLLSLQYYITSIITSIITIIVLAGSVTKAAVVTILFFLYVKKLNCCLYTKRE